MDREELNSQESPKKETGTPVRRRPSAAEREARRKKRRRQQLLRMGLLLLLVLLLLAGIVFLIVRLVQRKDKDQPETIPVVSTTSPEEMTEPPTTAEPEPAQQYGAVYEEAKRFAAMYDYDRAVEHIKTNVPGYESDAALLGFVQTCEAEKMKLVKWKDNTQITHIFFHSLIADKDVAFGSYKRDEYNQVMTTIPEFNSIMETMYARGYVLVHLSDICKMETLADGTQQMTMQEIWLPEGKTPFVLSIDDLSYYEYMKETGGFASRLVIAEDGSVDCEMDLPDGTKEIGNFDVVPLLDDFVDAHPDFSYHGAKGTIALTGYNGILGYRTSEISYGSKDPAKVDLSIYERWPETYEYENPNIEQDRETAKAVVQRLKDTGWKFASHTWGHMDMGKVRDADGNPTERFYRDTDWWEQEVKPLLGDVDIIIFAFGADIGSWRGYTDDNKMYTYLKQKGFNYFCNVDSSTHAWVQYNKEAGGSGYFRQGRRNLDGMLLYKACLYPENEILSDIIDPLEVIDRDRPFPVVGVAVPEGVDGSTLPAAEE